MSARLLVRLTTRCTAALRGRAAATAAGTGYRAFVQDPPRLGNQYTEDSVLRALIGRLVPAADVRAAVDAELTRFGARVAGELGPLARECEENPPRLRSVDAWGRRVQEVVTCGAWKGMRDIAAEEGLVAIAYERTHGEYSRILQFAKLYLFGPSSGLYNCPLAMTDGAAKYLETHKLSGPPFDDVGARLRSRSKTDFWTAGQWMTEQASCSVLSCERGCVRTVKWGLVLRCCALLGATRRTCREVGLT